MTGQYVLDVRCTGLPEHTIAEYVSVAFDEWTITVHGKVKCATDDEFQALYTQWLLIQLQLFCCCLLQMLFNSKNFAYMLKEDN